MNWIDAAKNESAGKDIMLASLTPKFDEASHRVYYDLLTRAIDHEGVHNVALTGAYGTGKSSVLEQLGRQRDGQVIEISLSTIAPPQRKANGDDAPEDEKAQTNLIQKEIVKQLLYRLPAHKTPKSRFRRTSAPQTKRDWLISSISGILTVTVALLLGLLQPLVESVVPEPWGRRILAYGVLTGGVICATWFIRRLIAGGPAMSASVGAAGLTSVTLTSATNTYFDEYLDEIVYFFQASKTKVVVIEDIDRFEDIKVFDALRALNVLLNSSSALERIVFVYAIRDSIFEKIEDVKSPRDEDATRRAVDVANRAKFFDVIVPVVPFVNADNARDLMSRAMKSKNFSIDQSLIRISARHAADMRLIHNIRNEFEVYRSRLSVPRTRVYGITDDLVFAMVVYKNAHLADFEKIRHKDSALDHLYKSWRELVRSNLKAEVNRLAKLRISSELDATADKRARLCGQRLLHHVETLRASLQSVNGAQSTISFVGEFDESKLQQRATWHAIASGKPLQLHARVPNGYNMTLAFSAEQLGAMLGITIDLSEWDEAVRSEIEAQIADCEETIRFLRHHTWAQLRLRPEFVLQNPEGSLTFDQLIREKLGSPLIEELVRRGFITSHFALYTSTYYGTHLGPDALEYVRRCIEPGEPDHLFELDTQSVQQLLIEQGAEMDDTAEIFDDASMRNVSIVDYLLQNRPKAAGRIAKGLTAWGEQEADFVASYCARGAEPERLLAAMAPLWGAALKYTAADAPLPPGKRVTSVDAVLGALPHSEGYDVVDKVRDLLETYYAEFTSLTAPTSSERAAITLGVFAACKATIRDVNPLNHHAREQVIARRLYPVTKSNLFELTQGKSLALDALRQADERVYKNAIDHLSDYLMAFADTPDTEHTIEDPHQFSKIVTKAGEKGNPEDIRRLVSQSSGNCRVSELAEVPPSAWPTILAEDRAPANFTNIHSYIDEYGQVDDVLAAFLNRHNMIEWDEDTSSLEDRRDVARAILNAADTLPDAEDRIGLVAQLEPGELPIDSIKSEAGKFASRLIEENLIPDDAETFASALMVDWNTREAAIAASEDFESFVSPETLPVSQIPELLQSEKINTDVKKTVVGNLAEYLAQGTRQQAEDIARALNARQWKIRLPRIQALMDRGVAAPLMIQLILRTPDLTIDKMRELLREMGDPYARLADLGHRPALVPDDDVHNALLERLEGVTVSSSKKAGTQLRVNMFRTER
ncbi:YobI family P-loop NTPase [Paenarthrobacter nitroguajacolicus]|uniref:YobI family P-loop NTPase n=1 Tax=Paenarthrobacter nitroguajacolicus TaxID=211146 RepID=UPI000AC7C62A|nr:P-loop NTPase fold protein [Paenarthrobacter nitroguajacolicus]